MQKTESNVSSRNLRWLDWLVAVFLFLLTFSIYLRTLAPSVAYLFDDSLEFQLLASRMAIAHPTGYPLYSILIKLATFLPIGDVAYRVNLVSALCGAGTIAFVYLAARLITTRFLTSNNLVGEFLTRAPALIAALILAFGETFWSQAVIAEVYALQAFLTAVMLWLVLRWGIGIRGQGIGNSEPTPNPHPRSLLLIAFFAGLMLTHHRLSALLLPAIAVYVLSYDRVFLKQPRTLAKIALAFVLPLLLYLYLPIRGTVTSSLDGAYQNTPEGFLNWILGTAYTVFISQNPLSQTRDAAYYFNLFVNEFDALGLLAAVGGFVALFLRAWREWVLLALALLANLVFVFTYRVADINVFFIPTFVIGALFLAAGLAGLLWLAYYALPQRWATLAASVGAILLLLLPFGLFRAHYARVDLSNKRDVIEYGRALLSQPLPQNATVIGILGEMSLLRYLQENENLRPDVETIAADKEDERFQAIDDALKRNRTVFLTRPLSGIEKQASLTSVGSLIQLEPKANRSNPPSPAQVLNADFGDVKLLGYDAQLTMPTPRVTLYWQPQRKISDARLVSLKLIDGNGKLAGQIDRQPVLDAYPTNAWRANEYIADSYAVPVFVGAAPGEYTLQVTLYDPNSGQVFGQRELGRITIPAQTQNVARELLGVQETVLQDLGDAELSGYDLDTSEPYPTGAEAPLTLLWRQLNVGARDYDITLSDEFGKVVQTQTANFSGDAGQYIRQDLAVKLPATLAPGKYILRVTLRGGFPLPFQTNTVTLGTLEVQAP
ncbi:MAG: DUF2723 domain-containing protein [Chloroflexota bacterium]|nr:MAG: DUF2723 domain-containing protein [Chloroflexota bacterium]